jgi:hypothetical protein
MNYPCKAFSVSLSSPALTVSQYTSSDWSLADTEYDRVRRALDEDFLPETLLKHGMLCMTCILTERVIRGPNGFLIFCCILLPYCYHIVTILLPSIWHIFQEDSQCLLMSRRRVGLQSIHLFTWTGRQFPSKLRISLSVHTSNGTLLDEEMNIYGICDRPLTYPSARRSNLGLRIVCQLPQCAQQDGASRQSLML